MVLTIVLVTIAICLIVACVWIINSRYNYFKRRNISGPPPRFFYGHYKEFWSTDTYSKQLQEWTRRYGSIYGLFEGTRPMYVVSDVDFLQEVYIKQFSSFHSRSIPKILQGNSNKKVHLFRATGAKWRRQRHVINPTFSAAKLKLMSPLVNGCIKVMLNKVSEIAYDKKKEINIYNLYKRMTMDVICK
jgi:cytochrome P450